jgi:DNA-binding HxlR family transcriptional regulator
MGATTKEPAGVRACAIADGLELLGERWALLILRELFWGNTRFGGIQEKTGAPRDILSARLKLLTEEGLVERVRYSERPPRDEYLLTDAGRAVQPILLGIQEWALEHRPRPKRAPATMRMEHHGHEVDPETHVTCRVCGEEIEPE